MTDIYGFVFDGSLSVTPASVPVVGDSLEQDICTNLIEVTRLTVDVSSAVTYYIKYLYNINSLIDFSASDPSDNLDDAWGFQGFDISLAGAAAGDYEYNLPTASDVDVSAGKLSIYDSSDTFVGSFDVRLRVDVDSSAVMAASIHIDGADVTVTEVEDVLKAQGIYIDLSDVIVPDISNVSADILSYTVSATDLSGDSRFITDLSSVKNTYDGLDLIDNWTLSVNEQALDVNNTISKHARFLGKTTSTVFEQGHRIICSDTATFEVLIENYQGNNVTVVSQETIYGILEQT